MERMKTYGNSMIEMLLLFPGTVSSPMFELPIWLSDNGGPQLMSCAPFADMRMNVDALTHVFSLQAARGPHCGPSAYFSGPSRAHVVGAQILPMVFNSIPQKMEIHRVASVLLVVQVSEGVMIRHSRNPG